MNNLIGKDLIQHGHIPPHLPVSLRERKDDAGNSPFKDVITAHAHTHNVYVYEYNFLFKIES
jgi:hypothetical protein